MRVLLADDHALVRNGLKLVLQHLDPGVEVLEAGDGREAVSIARREKPDMALIDITMPGLNGIDAIPLLREAAPRMRLLIVSMHGTKQYVSEALRAGAHGYLLKDSAVDELVDAQRALRENRPFLSRKLADLLLSDLVRQAPAQADSPRARVEAIPLSPRQREVLQRIAEGRTTREIAEALHLSVKTVETHRAEIMRRLDIYDVAGLTRYAVRMGMVSLDS